MEPLPRALYLLRVIPSVFPDRFFLCFSTTKPGNDGKIGTQNLEPNICDQTCILYPSSPCKTYFLSGFFARFSRTLPAVSETRKKTTLDCIRDSLDKVREALRQVKARNFIRGRGADPGVWDVSTVAFLCLEKRLRDEPQALLCRSNRNSIIFDFLRYILVTSSKYAFL